jgi:hypothetical protein
MALTKVHNRVISGAYISADDYGASPSATATQNTTAIQTAINEAHSSKIGTVLLGAGQYDINGTIDLKGKWVKLIGCGMKHTILNVTSAVTTLFDIEDTVDVINSPFVLSDFNVYGNGNVTTCISVTKRHMFEIKDIEINGVTNGIKETNTWSSIHRNVRINASYDGLFLNGSNHGSTFERVSITSFSNYGLIINPGLDGNIALGFYNCDVQFSAAGAAGSVYINGTTVTFDTCYIGEQCEGTTVFVQNGFVNFQGGILMYGWTAGDVCFSLTTGCNVTVSDTEILEQGSSDLSGLIYAPATGSPAVSGQITMNNVLIPTGITGNTFWTGDPLGFGPSQIVFASRYGRNYTTSFVDITGTDVNLYNEKTLTCSTVTGASPVMSMYYTLQNLAERSLGVYQNNYLAVVYKSNVNVDVIVSGGSGGVAPTKTIGTMPASSGEYFTFIQVDDDIFDANYTTLEFVVSGASAGNTFTIREVYLSDERVLGISGPGRASLNLYKP